MPCSLDKCPRSPRWVPVLALRGRRADEPTRVKFRRLGYCDEHREACGLDTFLSGEGSAKLSKLLREAGLPEPDPRLTELAWERVASSDRSRLANRQDHTTSEAPDEGVANPDDDQHDADQAF